MQSFTVWIIKTIDKHFNLTIYVDTSGKNNTKLFAINLQSQKFTSDLLVRFHQSENPFLLCKGKYQYTDGLLFDGFGFNQTI